MARSKTARPSNRVKPPQSALEQLLAAIQNGGVSSTLHVHLNDGPMHGPMLDRAATRIDTPQLPVTVARTDQTQTFTAAQTIAHNSGITIKNTAATNSVAITATGTSQLTFGGSIVTTGTLFTDTYKPNSANGAMSFLSDGGISVQATDATESARIRALHRNTTGSTATTLTFNGNAATSANIPSIAVSTTHAYMVTVTGRNTSSGASAAMIILKGVLERSAGGTVTLLGQAGAEYVYRSNAALDATLVADDTNKGLSVNVTGLAATNITWVAAVQETTI